MYQGEHLNKYIFIIIKNNPNLRIIFKIVNYNKKIEFNKIKCIY